ncbi:MAG: hypothetical protein MUE85_04035 [Microscillaceae bacterium]|nr:hypothetical protein [Microscillaceae bacterium]
MPYLITESAQASIGGNLGFRFRYNLAKKLAFSLGIEGSLMSYSQRYNPVRAIMGGWLSIWLYVLY